MNYDLDQVQMVIVQNDLYTVTPEWRRTVLQWLYDHQNRETGLWGPRSRSGRLMKKDLNNTASVMKAFMD